MTRRDGSGSFWLLVLMGGMLATLPPWAALTPTAIHAEPNRSAESTRQAMESTSTIFESVANLMSPAVVYLEATRLGNSEEGEEESGSGVLVRPRGTGRPVVVTNYHVVANCLPEDIDILLSDGRLLHPTRVWHDEETDIAVLDPDLDDLPAVRMGNSDEVRIGQWVLAIGSPFGLSQSVTHGIISAKHRRQIGISGTLRIKEFLQTDAAINPGSSGGPLVNLDGEVIGINTAIASRTGSSSGVAFSIPVNLVRWVAEDLLVHGKVRRGFLGVEFPRRFGYERARGLGLAVARGALISVVHPGTPAADAGLRTDDVVLEFGGVPIEDENHLINAVSQTEVGKPVRIIVWRDRKRVALETVLGSWDAYQTTDKKPADSTSSSLSGR